MTELNLPERIFARGEEPAGERVNTYHKPKRIESILEALDPEEGSFGQYVIVRRLRVRKKYEIWFLFGGNPY